MPDLNLIGRIHHAVEQSIQENAAREDCWHEDQITRDWLKALEKALNGYAAEGEGIQIRLAAWKLTGTSEHQNGDVAVLARIRHAESDRGFDGVGFLEAKRSSYRNPFSYPQYDSRQHARVAQSSNHRYVFYRRETLQATRSKVLPSYLVRCFDEPFGDNVFLTGSPLSIQLTRYCRGWDLDPAPPLRVPDGVPFLLTIAVGHLPAEIPRMPSVPEGYDRIANDDDHKPSFFRTR